MSLFDDDFFKNIDKQHQDLYEEFKKLCGDTSINVPKKGDRVLVAAGLLGKGYPWIRKEAVVCEVADTSIMICYTERIQIGEKRGEFEFEWIHPALITDILRNEKE